MFYFLGLFLIITLFSRQSTVTGVPNDNEHKSENPHLEKVKVDLYYESLCKDCTKFDTTQLLPTMKQIGSYIDLHMHPYGKATMFEEFDGSWNFTCQHGEKECYGNKLHACAIAKLGKDQVVEFTSCLMTEKSDDWAVDECAWQLRKYSIDGEPIKDCAKKLEGDELLKNAGDETKNAGIPIDSVPCVIINGKKLPHVPGTNDTLVSFMEAVCSNIEIQPVACEELI